MTQNSLQQTSLVEVMERFSMLDAKERDLFLSCVQKNTPQEQPLEPKEEELPEEYGVKAFYFAMVRSHNSQKSKQKKLQNHRCKSNFT